MPEYVVEDLQTEEQGDSFEAQNLDDAINHATHREDVYQCNQKYGWTFLISRGKEAMPA